MLNGTYSRKIEELIGNAVTSRSAFFQQLMDPRRDIDAECGYPCSPSAVNIELYKQLYDREALAARVVECLPRESWQVQPEIYEDEDPNVSTEFEKAWDELDKNLLGNGRSWHKQETGSLLYEYFLRLDILSGIGHFGVLLLGFDDGQNLEQPVDGVVDTKETPITKNQAEALVANLAAVKKPATQAEIDALERLVAVTENRVATVQEIFPPGGSLSGTDQQYFGVQFGPPETFPDKPSSNKRKLLFLRPFDESLVQIVRYEWNIRSPRFGQPVMYRVTLNDPREVHSGVGLPLATVFVHWSRLIHVPGDRGTSEIFGIPRQRPVLNRLLDLRKLYSGSGEMYWRGAFPGLSLETNPQLGGEVDLDKQATMDMMEQYMNGLQRYLVLMGMSAKTLAPTVVDPTPQITMQIQAICIKLAIPLRIFQGAERGQLASSQDDAKWNDVLKARQALYLTPLIICAFVDRLIAAGVLPEPKQYFIAWPDLDSNTDKDKVIIAHTKTQALQAYVMGGVEAVMPPLQYYTQVLGMDDLEAQTLIDAAAKAEAEGNVILPTKAKFTSGDRIEAGEDNNPATNFNPNHGEGGKFSSDPLGGAADTRSKYADANGKYSAKRIAAVHAPALAKVSAGIPKAIGPPTLYMTGGGSGSGKSAIVDPSNANMFGFPTKGTAVLSDPDAMKKEIPEYSVLVTKGDVGAAGKVHEESADLAKQAVNDALHAGVNAIYDTTGDSSASKLAEKVAAFRKAGAGKVVANYIFPGSVEEAQKRADARGKKTGRYVPASLLSHIHAEVSRVWQTAAKNNTFDDLKLWSSAGPQGQKPSLVAHAVGGKVTVLDQPQYDAFTKIGKS